ncbi:unnamed protein product [Heligmosomoides polygyrus]|uniref:glucuronosyltransferase n=1 Tax=Heligmosomoides polygyrus TaxID=6339 RepID=A0A3P7ZWW4_HELPZ|nr:unnamed protein product [Heligmosomoides polygyrus]
MTLNILLLTTFFAVASAYNFLVISPLFGHSHSNFMGTIADTLTEAGHNVTVLMPIMDPDMEQRTGLRLTTHVIKVPPDNRTAALFVQKAKFMTRLWNIEPSVFGMMEMSFNKRQDSKDVLQMSSNVHWGSEGVLKASSNMRRDSEDVPQTSNLAGLSKVFNDDDVMAALREMQFDVGIAEAFDICGFGIFELLNVRATIATTSSVRAEVISKLVGIPAAPSYVPGIMSTKGDEMGMFERLQNVIETVLGSKFFETLFDMEISAFRKKFGDDFKGYEELLQQVSYVFTNSNPYLDYPHPTIHKSVDIGGIAVSFDDHQNSLPEVNIFSFEIL